MKTIECKNCGNKLRFPSNKHIKIKCPKCDEPYEIRNGAIVKQNGSKNNELNKKAKDAIDSTLGVLILSLIAFLVLIIFFEAIREYGLGQLIFIIILHIVGISLLGTVKNNNDLGKARTAMWSGILWNIGIIGYSFYFYNEYHFFVDTKALASTVSGAGFLAFYYIKNLVKLNKYA